MPLRILAIAVMFCGTVTCGDDLLDLNEAQMRIIAKQLRDGASSGAMRCGEAARRTVHADLHLSPAQREGLGEFRCLPLPTRFTCRAELCVCSTDGEQDDDGDYDVDCTHTEDGKTTREAFKFSAEEVAVFDSETAPPDTTPPAGTPSGTASSTANPVVCAAEGEETLRYGESVLQLATDHPVLVSDEDLAGLVCSSSERGGERVLRCEGSVCECTATFRVDVVPVSARCVELSL